MDINQNGNAYDYDSDQLICSRLTTDYEYIHVSCKGVKLSFNHLNRAINQNLHTY